MVFVFFLQLMVWWRHKRYSWVFPSRRELAASIDLHNLKMSPQWLKIWQEQKNKLPDTSSNPEGWHRQNYVWVFMLHIQKEIQKCTKRKTRICLVWTNTTSLSLSELIRRWLSSKHFVPERPLQPPPQKPSKSCWIFSLQGRQLHWLAGTKWALCALKRKKYQPETSYRTFKYKYHTCNDWFVRISVILHPNDHLKPQDHIHVSRFDWLKRNVSDVIAADQTARMLNLETRDLNPARCEITCESPWWLGLFFRGVGPSQSQKTFFMGKSGW